MAQIDPNVGIPTVAPDAAPSDRSQHIRVSADQFGAQVGQGLEKLGAGATTAGKFFGQVAADDAGNQYQDFATKLIHGDPTQQTLGPDGTMQPDLGYMGLRGEAALRARPEVERKLDEKMKELRSNLTTLDQQLNFDTFSNRFKAGISSKVGSYADEQAKTYYKSVNDSTGKLALDHIANNFQNPQEVAAGAADLAHAYVKNAQLSGAQEGSPQIAEAVANAKRDALATQLNAMAVKDPFKAMQVLDKNKEIAGIQYDNLASAFRARADEYRGYDVGKKTIEATYAKNPAPNPQILNDTGERHGISGSYLQRVHQLEGNGTSSTGAQGPFQFIPSTAAKYGLKDPFNYEQAADAAARLASDNKNALTVSIGRTPTDPELYLAHQQGAGGAGALLKYPNLTATQALMTLPRYHNDQAAAEKAIRVNGGDPSAPAIDFTSMWAARYNKAPKTDINHRKATAYQDIIAIPDSDITPAARQHAFTYVNHTFAAQAVADEQNSKAKKEADDLKQAEFTKRIIQGDTQGIINQISTSGLDSSSMQNLYKFATSEGGIDNTLQNGPGYTDAIKRILSSPDDPGHISSVADIIQMHVDGQLTKKGVGELTGTMEKIKKNPDQAGIERSKSSQLQYYKSQMAIDSESPNTPGFPDFKNKKGLDKFNHDFVPAFESAYAQWVGKGHDPMEFLTDKKRMDAIMDSVYPPAQRKLDSLFANNQTPPPEPAPPAPEGVPAKAWDRLIAAPPHQTDGKPWAAKSWATAITRLRENADNPAYVNGFNAKFGPSGYTAQDILSRLPPTKTASPESNPGTVQNTTTPAKTSSLTFSDNE